MNILFATSQATSLVRGGVLTQVLQTKEALEKLGVKVTLFDMWKDIDIREYDLVHIFSANFATYHLARAFKVKGIPIIISPIFFTRRSKRLVKGVIAIDKFINRISRGFWTDYGLIAEMCHWAKAVTPNTKEEATLFQQAFSVPKERIDIIPNGVEERFAHASPDLFVKQYGMKDFILSVGHIGPQRKNVLRLIKALEKIDHPSAIIGRIENTPSGIACIERAKRNPRLLILDSIPHNSMLLASAYAACDVFVLPSQFETPGIAALEAAVAGAKIVITPIGGTKEYFSGDAIYVNPYSVKDIANGIKTALQKDKSSNLKERIMNQYSWKKVAEKAKLVYENVLNNL